jgi:hypothetical protein
MRNDTGANLWLMGWLFFVGYALAKDVSMNWLHWVASILIWPMYFASSLVASGTL